MAIPSITNKDIQVMAKRMNLPLNYIHSSRNKIPESVIKQIDKYTNNFGDYLSRGVGFVLSGGQGIGKSSISCYLAKFAKMYLKADSKFCTVYFTTCYDYRKKFRNKEMFDDEHSIYDWCRKVDFLVLDNLRQEDADPSWPGPVIYTELIAPRCAEGKSTVITTNLNKNQLKHHFPELCHSMSGYMLFLDVKGPDLRAEKAKALNEEFSNTED